MNATLPLLLAGTIGWSVGAQPLIPATVSQAGAPTISASGNSFMPLLSGDRRHVVFLSSAKNLDTNDNLAPHLDVYRHDLLTGQNTLISRGNADSSAPSVSSNGQWIAFASRAIDIGDASDTNGASDIYLSTGALISADISGNPPPNAIAPRSLQLSDDPRISANGRWVAFQSFATNLTAEADLNNESDVFLRDTLNNRTYLISVAVDAGSTANSKSELAAITPDGNYVLFTSTATNLVGNAPTNGSREVYLRDVAAGTTSWIRHTDLQPYVSRWALISADARFVLYKLEFPGSNFANIVLYDRQTDNSTLLASNSRPAYPMHMSSDGRFVAYDDSDRVYLWERQGGTRSIVSDNAGNAASHSPLISQDGSLVAFVSANTNAPFQIYYRNMTTGQTRRLTENSSGDPSGKDHDGGTIVVDPQGEFILFDSAEDQLVANDRNQASDIFIHTIATGETRLLSRAFKNSPSFTPFGTAGITNFCVSADGNRILFFSQDSNLVPVDTNGWYDAFLREISTGRNIALTTDSNGEFSPRLSTRHGLLTPNGRFAFLGIVSRSNRFDLSGASGSIIRRDLDTGETLVVASNLPPRPSESFSSTIAAFGFSVSPDGRWVAYAQPAPNSQVLTVVDLQSGTRISGEYFSGGPVITHDGALVFYGDLDSPKRLLMTEVTTQRRTIINSSYLGDVAINPNGTAIIYKASATNGPAINLFSIADRTSAQICVLCDHALLSADGRFAVFESYASIVSLRQIRLKDMQTGTTTLVSENIYGTGGADANATWPVISADGRYVAYASKATDLTTDPPNGWNNLYVYDRLQGTTIRITGTRGNTGYGSGSASKPVFSPDGRTLVFQSFASDFVANDFNDTRDIFLLKLGEGDADNDGMSDSWEQTHFSTTERDGTGDFDQDGSTDLAEYLAGTNPANGQSVFEVLQITSVGTNERQLIWSAEPGKSYRLEYKTDLSGAIWTSLGQIITATSSTASALDTTATAEKRFYRVALVQ